MFAPVPAFQAIQAFDESVLRLARETPGWAVPIFVIFTVIGAGWGLLLFLPLLVHPRSRVATLFLLLAAGATNSAVNAVKVSVGRIRPCEALGWCTPISISSPGGWSFPSGHAACSFAVAMFVALRAHTLTRHHRWVGMVMFVYATLVAWSRVVLGVHYPSDILAGSALGIAIGALFVAALGYWERRVVNRSARSPGGSDRDDPGRDPASAAP